jgi:predicted nucleic acid-binding protein
MFLLDTNVLSDMMRPDPTSAVAAWVVRQDTDELWTASICKAEILAGIAVMPDGRRRQLLETAARAMFDQDFEGRVLAFDSEAAEAYGHVFAVNRRAGKAPGAADLMIASIALSRDARVVTRNVAHFQASGIDVINPWDVQ